MTDENETEHDDDIEDGGGAPSGKTFSQAEVDDLLSKARRRGRRARDNELGELFGGRKAEDVAGLLKALDEREQESMTEAERRAAEADRKMREADEAMEKAAKAALRATLIQELAGADTPVRSDRIQVATDLAMSHASRSDEDELDAIVAAAVDHVRGVSPEWFGDSSAGTSASHDLGAPKRPASQAPRRGATKQPSKAEAMLDRFYRASGGRMSTPDDQG